MRYRVISVFIGLFAASNEGHANPVHATLNDLGATRIHLSGLQYTGIGEAVRLAGDLNGDGYIDIAVGAPNFSPSESDPSGSHGAVFVLNGSDVNLDSEFIDIKDNGINGFRVVGEAGSLLGASLADLCDINADGFDDLAIGAPGIPAGIILFGRQDHRRVIHMTELHGEAAIIENTGQFTAPAGDINQDGFQDVLFSHPIGGDGEGGLLTVVFGGTNIPRQLDARRSGQHHLSVSGGDYGRLGASIAGRLIISSHGRIDFAAMSESSVFGKAFLFHGGSPFSAKVDSSKAIPGVYRFVENVGDINGSGYTELALGANLNRAWLVWGGNFSPGGIDMIASTPKPWGVLLENAPKIAAIGDVNGNGYNDIAICMPDANVGEMERAGIVVLIFGDSNWPNRIDIHRVIQGESAGVRSMVVYGNEPNARLGASIHGGADIQGDGYADLMIGAPSVPGSSTGGAAYVIQGRAIHERLNSPVTSLPYRP